MRRGCDALPGAGFAFAEEGPGGPPEFSQAVNQLTYTNLAGMDLRPGLASLRQPVLLMMGRDDPFGLPMAESIREALVQARVEYVVLDACGHFWHECPEAFYARVADFLGLADRHRP